MHFSIAGLVFVLGFIIMSYISIHETKPPVRWLIGNIAFLTLFAFISFFHLGVYLILGLIATAINIGIGLYTKEINRNNIFTFDFLRSQFDFLFLYPIIVFEELYREFGEK
jgi:hypothetical protein